MIISFRRAAFGPGQLIFIFDIKQHRQIIDRARPGVQGGEDNKQIEGWVEGCYTVSKDESYQLSQEEVEDRYRFDHQLGSDSIIINVNESERDEKLKLKRLVAVWGEPTSTA